MALHINADLLKRLEAIAQQRQQNIDEMINKALENFVSQEEQAPFEERLNKHMQEHKWLLDELAKR